MSEDEVEFMKKVPSHPRNGLKIRTKKDVVFVKKVPSNPRDKKNTKKTKTSQAEKKRQRWRRVCEKGSFSPKR